ncbi:hypothetical protein D3C72_2378900 [compost metagenome]
MLIEYADIKSGKLFTASDINGFTVKSAKVEAKDSVISLLGSRKLTFDEVEFIVPGNALELSVSSSEEPVFIRSKPQIIKH